MRQVAAVLDEIPINSVERAIVSVETTCVQEDEEQAAVNGYGSLPSVL